MKEALHGTDKQADHCNIQGSVRRKPCSDEKCACKLLEALQCTQPTLSHHMKILCDSGLVVGRKEGKWMYYSISAEGMLTAVDVLRELSKVSGSGECCCK